MTTSRASKRVLGGAIWLFALVAVLGFTAEPSTSTQYDAREGRGVLVTGTASQAAPVIAKVADRPVPRAVVVLVAMLAALLLGATASRTLPDEGRERLRSSLRWHALARRGPPAAA